MISARCTYDGGRFFGSYDLTRHQYAACKLHRVSDGWTDGRKEAFVRLEIAVYTVPRQS